MFEECFEYTLNSDSTTDWVITNFENKPIKIISMNPTL